jgi:hypothetical protein
MSLLTAYAPTLVGPAPGNYGATASDTDSDNIVDTLDIGAGVVVTDSAGLVALSPTTKTELGYVSGVTSAIQTQMDLKAPKASPTFTGTVHQAPVAISGTDIDFTLGNTRTKTLSASVTMTFSNAVAGDIITVIITGDASHTVTWPTVTWRGGATPVQTLSKVDFYTFYFDGTTYFGSASQNY